MAGIEPATSCSQSRRATAAQHPDVTLMTIRSELCYHKRTVGSSDELVLSLPNGSPSGGYVPVEGRRASAREEPRTDFKELLCASQRALRVLKSCGHDIP